MAWFEVPRTSKKRQASRLSLSPELRRGANRMKASDSQGFARALVMSPSSDSLCHGIQWVYKDSGLGVHIQGPMVWTVESCRTPQECFQEPEYQDICPAIWTLTSEVSHNLEFVWMFL